MTEEAPGAQSAPGAGFLIVVEEENGTFQYDQEDRAEYADDSLGQGRLDQDQADQDPEAYHAARNGGDFRDFRARPRDLGQGGHGHGRQDDGQHHAPFGVFCRPREDVHSDQQVHPVADREVAQRSCFGCDSASNHIVPLVVSTQASKNVARGERIGHAPRVFREWQFSLPSLYRPYLFLIFGLSQVLSQIMVLMFSSDLRESCDWKW